MLDLAVIEFTTLPAMQTINHGPLPMIVFGEIVTRYPMRLVRPSLWHRLRRRSLGHARMRRTRGWR